MKSDPVSSPQGFSTAPLKTLAAKVRAGATPTGGSNSYLDKRSKFVLVRSQNVLDHEFAMPGLANISDEQAADLDGARLEANDVLLNITGDGATFGRACLVPAKILPACVNQHVVLIRTHADRCAPGYLAAWLALPDTKPYIESFNAGGSRRAITKGHIESFEVPLPPMAVQDAIARLAEDINTQIETLRETNTTLEAIAQAIFKSWFIDFDPVRAKSEGRIPDGIDEDTATLFPDSFQESAVGAIPKGWRVATLAEHVTADRGLSYKGAGLCGPEEGLPMHNLNSVLEGGDYKYRGIKYYNGEHKDKHLVLAGEIIVANTEQGHDHRLIGFPAIVPASYPKGIFSHHLYRVRLKETSSLTKHFVYYTLMAPRVRDQIISCANGSTVNMLKSAGLEIPMFACPPQELAVAFDGITAALRAQMEANIAEAETLADLRDTLLPRLISGKLKLPELQEVAEAL